jgi:hypothetical protein
MKTPICDEPTTHLKDAVPCEDCRKKVTEVVVTRTRDGQNVYHCPTCYAIQMDM